ncbi:MAG: glycolate oxidase subunit GlcF [Leptothrix sp. (in: Bacteria)]|nr:glycolate oxidase subunit GlcF [Leptothrix sp. (in: b-proteobacteria)]
MQTQLAPEFRGTPDGDAAEAILRRCVHCGFCTATCPTYQLLGDELDGPRGRIYLIKQVLEGSAPTRKTQQHLDRCLTCRNCETTCPSGVQYGQLIEVGRRIVDAKVDRPASERRVRWLLREGMTSSAFAPALRLGQALRPLLPAALKAKVPEKPAASQDQVHRWPAREHPRKVLLLLGCVQPALAPNINSATARVLDACGIQTLVADGAGCCGAVRAHLGDHERARADMRRNIDAWWPLVEGLGGSTPVEAIVVNASGCGLMVKEYGHVLADDPDYADKARRVSEVAKDLSELLPSLVPALRPKVASALQRPQAWKTVGFHPPCTLQHGQKVRGVVETALSELGMELRMPNRDAHLCCGSAGTYSVLQPELAFQLRDRKLESFSRDGLQVIASANIGCIQHLQSGSALPVRHWVEVVDRLLTPESHSI